jgi:hypothetical protein
MTDADKAKAMKGFSLAGMLKDVITSIGDFFWKGDGSGILELDLTKLKDIIPDWMKDPVKFFKEIIAGMVSWMPNWVKKKMGIPITKTKEEKEEEEKKQADILKAELKLRADAAKKREKIMAALKEDILEERTEILSGDLRVGPDWGPGALREDRIKESNEKLAELVKQNEKAKALDIEFKKKATTKSKDSSIFTHDQGLHDRLDRIFPTAVSGGRATAMMQAGIQRGMGGGAGGGGITSINTGGNVVSSPTTNYVNNGIAARRPILMTAPTALA